MSNTKRFRLFSTIVTANMRSYSYDQYVSSPRIMAKILSGRALAEQMNKELRHDVNKWIELGHKQPRLVCIIVGDNPASHSYVKSKIKSALEVGIDAKTITFDATVSEPQLIEKIRSINNDASVDGLLVQLPLPAGLNERNVCNAVAPEKDVDGFHIHNVGRFCLDMPALLPATPRGVAEIMRRYKIDTFGKNAVVIGRSKNVGMPLAMILHSDGQHESRQGMDATVTICHRHTPPDQLRFFCKNADIIIAAAGVPNLVKADMVKPGATVIDVGITRVVDKHGITRLCGDVDFAEVSKVAGAITPVPGGVGPMTVAMLLHNTFQAARDIAERDTLNNPVL